MDDSTSNDLFCRCLWFVLEPLIGRTEDYNYAFLRRMIEKIKQTKDVQGPDDEGMNMVCFNMTLNNFSLF